MKSYKIEYFPDRADHTDGTRAFSIQYNVHNEKRFKALNRKEKKELISHIERFERHLGYLKAELGQAQKPSAHSTKD
jgi:hypothetical protein